MTGQTTVNELVRRIVAERKRHPRIFIVDDDENDLAMMERVISRIGSDVTVRKRSDDAIRYVVEIPEDRAPDLILLDLKVPPQNGVEVLRAVKMRWVMLPVVIVTGYASSQELVEASHVGYFGLIEKPLSEKGLTQIFGAHKIPVNPPEDK